MKYYFYLVTICALLLSSCATVNKTQLESVLAHSNCNQQNVYTYTVEDLPKPIYQLQIDSSLNATLTPQSLNVANAIGILEYLSDYVKYKNYTASAMSVEKRLEKLELAQKINQHINIASIEISAISSEIDCEEERAGQIASYLEGKRSSAESKLTVASIVVGAAGAVTTGLLLANRHQGNATEYIGIGAGIAEATMGLMILLDKRKVNFSHPRNALRDIWEGKEVSSVFPPAVWYYLNYQNPQESDSLSLRQQIINHWMDFGQIAQSVKDQKAKDIYFDDGGKYTAEQLENRTNMLDQLEAQINLMKQDLKALAIEIQNL